MATHSSILAWNISGTQEPGGLQSMGSQAGTTERLTLTYLQTAEKRREAKGKGEKERYTHLNTESQRIARRDKKTFLSDRCKEIEENNRLGKTRVLYKKIRDSRETFHAKVG